MPAGIMNTQDMFPGFEPQPEVVAFTPTRQAGLARLEKFVSRAGRHYARRRNYDLGSMQRGNVSALSPWIRHRLITEQEVLNSTCSHHSMLAAEKFVQEVFWRTYFKGWLEQHPNVWVAYQDGLARALDADARSSDYQDAMAGRTGIACFDHWVQELVQSGYLHNHVRMWFASIWIFTLRLPWQLGADFFLRHLIDGDPASNTLSWRWVGGLHTKGKTYLARPDNIAKYTDGRFHPVGQLATVAEPLMEQVAHPLVQLPATDPTPKEECLLFITEEDCQVETLLPHTPMARLGLLAKQSLGVSAIAQNFSKSAVEATSGTLIDVTTPWRDQIIEAAMAAGTNTVVTGYAPVGPVADQLAALNLPEAGITLHHIRRDYDTLAWPHATKGFFGLKKKIPHILRELGFAV